jgi:hypothetical protein
MDAGTPKTSALNPDAVAGAAEPKADAHEGKQPCTHEGDCKHDPCGLHDAVNGCGCSRDHDHDHDHESDAVNGCGCSRDHDHDHESDADYDPEDESFLGDGAPTVDQAAPEIIDELAAACVRFVHDTIQVELDYTPETLPLLDHYLGIARGLLAEKLELRELVLRAAGAYFGEVLRRRLNGYWLIPTEDVHSWRVCGRHVLMSLNPVGVIAEALAENEDADGPSGVLRLARADQQDVTERLAEMPPLPENEFYLTSTRLEVIDIVVEHLRMRMEQNNQADMEFDPDDYVGDLQPYGKA